MASALKKTKTTVTKLTVTGDYNLDTHSISYIGDDKEEHEITLEECLDSFADSPITLTVQMKEESDLDDETDGE